MIITLLGVNIVIVGSMTLALFQVTDVSEIKSVNWVFWILVLCSLNIVWLLSTLKRLCMIGVTLMCIQVR